jgi:hypothetical protein
MKIVGVTKSESEIQMVETQLKEAGLYGRYEGQVRGPQNALVMVRVQDVTEKEQVKAIFENSGVIEIVYQEDPPNI